MTSVNATEDVIVAAVAVAHSPAFAPPKYTTMHILGLISVPNWLLLTAIVLTVIYKYLTWNFGYWASQNVRTPKPIPLLGTLLPVFTKAMAETDIGNMKMFGKVWGAYFGRNPELITVDLNLIKAIGIKDFNHFVDRRSFSFSGASNIARYFLTVLEGDEWKAHRAVLSPTFTSGKLKQMVFFMEECSKELNQFVNKSIEDGKTELEMKDIFGAYTMNVIATCCFGYKIDSQNPKDPFILYAKEIFSQSFSIKFLIAFLAPKLFEYFKISIFPEKAFKYFQKSVNQLMAMRKDEKNRRGDFLDLLLDAEQEGFAVSPNPEGSDLNHYDIGSELKENARNQNKKKEKVLCADAIVAHSMLFLLAGYDTTASTISFATYFLALHPECQDKLVNEINETIKNHGKLSYQSIGEMQYLDKIISETLRFYPPAIRTERRCTKPYRWGEIEIKENMIVGISIYGIHHDEENYPEPEKFDPERFTHENKAQRNPVSFIPFGIGPRNCIGMRFALIEIKLALANFVREFRVSRSSKTEVPLKMKVGVGVLKAINGVHVNVEKRN